MAIDKSVIRKTALKYVLDIVTINLAFLFTIICASNFDAATISGYMRAYLLGIPISLTYALMICVTGGYASLWQWAGTTERVNFGIRAAISLLPYVLLHKWLAGRLLDAERSYEGGIYVLSLCVAVIALLALRTGYKLAGRYMERRSDKKKAAEEGVKPADKITNVMIIGAGDTGSATYSRIRNSEHMSGYRVRCFIDNDVTKIGSKIGDVLVAGDITSVADNVKKYEIDRILFAIPSCPSDEKIKILKICSETCRKVQVLRGTGHVVAENGITENDVRDIKIEDLLGREPIVLNKKPAREYIEGKTVLVTGGAGSIGSELCRQVSECGAKRLVIFDIYESNTYKLKREIEENYGDLDPVALIGSVRDADRVDAVFDKYRPDIVIHAAAHKHVPLMQDSPHEAIKNNVMGTYNVLKAADKYEADRCIVISTDKAVNPTNVMGASKRICEMLMQSMAKKSETKFAAVRFGNVLGSGGSVVPLFREQIKKGGPVTVTDRKMTRFFMTIPEAVSLVLEAGASAAKGEIFVLDMGEPVKILDLAENMIRLAGKVPDKDILIVETGIRDGEKLHEQLQLLEEKARRTENRLIFVNAPVPIDEELLFSGMEKLKNAMDDDDTDIRAYIREIVPTFHDEQYEKNKAAKIAEDA